MGSMVPVHKLTYLVCQPLVSNWAIDQRRNLNLLADTPIINIPNVFQYRYVCWIEPIQSKKTLILKKAQPSCWKVKLWSLTQGTIGFRICSLQRCLFRLPSMNRRSAELSITNACQHHHTRPPHYLSHLWPIWQHTHPLDETMFHKVCLFHKNQSLLLYYSTCFYTMQSISTRTELTRLKHSSENHRLPDTIPPWNKQQGHDSIAPRSVEKNFP